MSAPTINNVDRPRAFGFGVALGDRLFRLAASPQRPLQIVTAPLEAPRINTTSSAEEASDEFGLTFARSSFDGGDGLFRAHVEDAAPNRYWDSAGVRIRPAEPGEFPQIELLHATSKLDTNTATTLRMAYDTSGDALYTTAGSTLRRTDDPTGTPTTVADDPSAGETGITVHDVAVLGNVVYAALGANGIHRKVSGTWSHWSDTPATRIWALKGRIVASNGVNLYEVVAAGAAPTPVTILPTGQSHTDACDAGSRILVGADDGYVYAYTTDSGSLALSAQTLFEGEQVSALGQSQGVVAVGTRAGNVGRLYVGGLDSNGQVVDLQLVKTWGVTGTTVAQFPRRIIGTRASLVTGITDGTDTCLWRYDLISGGVSRDLCASAATGSVRGIEEIEGRTLFGVDGSGAWAEGSTYVSEGWLIGPLGDFYSASAKSWVGARLETDVIDGGEAVELHYTVDPEALSDENDPAWTRVTRRESGSGDPGEEQIVSVIARSLAGMVKLYPSSDRTTSPAVRSFSFRAYPSSGDEDVIITLPINVSDQIERRGRQRIKVPGRGAIEYTALRALQGRPVTMRLYKPALSVRGLVEEVGTPIVTIPHRGSATFISQVRIRGQIVSAGVTSGAGPFSTDREFGTALTFGESA